MKGEGEEDTPSKQGKGCRKRVVNTKSFEDDSDENKKVTTTYEFLDFHRQFLYCPNK